MGDTSCGRFCSAAVDHMGFKKELLVRLQGGLKAWRNSEYGCPLDEVGEGEETVMMPGDPGLAGIGEVFGSNLVDWRTWEQELFRKKAQQQKESSEANSGEPGNEEDAFCVV